MNRLKYLPDDVWQRLPVADFRARFFVETYCEKLSMYTPHFYQSRLMNVFSACAEMLEYIKEYQSNERNAAYVASSIEEIRDAWDSDPVAQEQLADLMPLRPGLLRSVQSGELGPNTLHRLKALCRAILCRKDDYAEAIFSALDEAVIGVTDFTQKERITSQIDRLTGLYTSHLLNQGYSPTYLFNRADLLSKEKNYADRDFAAQFRSVIGRLQSHRVISFEVYYGLHTNKPSALTSIVDDGEVEFLTELPADIQGSVLEKFRKNIDINVVAKAKISSTDYVSAALRTKERLDRFLDAATALEFSSELQVSAHCVVVHQNPPLTHRRALNVDMLLAFMSSEGGTSFSHPGASIRHAFKALDEDARDQLGRSLRYLRLARHSVSLEQKLLNLWIALESLFINLESNILANIIEYVPRLYAAAGLRRRVVYLRDLLVANEIPTTTKFQTDVRPGLVKFDASIVERDVFALLRNESAAIELFASLGNRERLKFKLMHIFHELKNNKSISARLSRSESDVTRQLRRIYFLRNKIAHTGHFQGVRPQLVTHLLDYVAVCYRAIYETAASAREGECYSIADIFAAARMGTDVVIERASSRDEIVSMDDLISAPVM